MEINQNLGKLEKVELKHVWPSEPQHFTPWLATAENLSLLADAIGIELEFEAQEKNVGPFRADILCKDTANDHWVLIENQLEKTDHTHLGQLITYASGLKAVNIVWIAKKFTEEHRAALDWLNDITDDQFNFFGLEVELWRIGNSPVAPKFNIVSKPNDWSKNVSAGARDIKTSALTDAKLLQLEFWTAFVEYVKEKGEPFRTTKPSPQPGMNIPTGKSGIKLFAVASFLDSFEKSFENNELRAEIVFDNKNQNDYFQQFEKEKEEINNEIGEAITWPSPSDKRTCKIYLRKPTNLAAKDQWPEQHEWLTEKITLLKKVFGPRIKALP